MCNFAFMIKYLQYIIKLRHIALILFVVFASFLGAEEKQYFFNRFALKEGLSQTTVHAVLRDSKGFLWIGTASGLNRFDGQWLSSYFAVQNGTHTLPGNRIVYITEDARNHVWISTSGGLALYDHENDRFLLQTYQDSAFLSYAHFLLPDGMVCCSEGALYKYVYETGQWEKLPIKSNHDFAFHFTGAALNNTGEVLLSTRNNGLFVYNLATHTLNEAAFYTGNGNIISMCADTENRLWIANYGEGVQCYGHDGRLLATYNAQNSALSNNTVLCIMQHDDKLWFGTDGGGINILNPENYQFEHIRHIPENTASFPANSIISFYKDTWNNIWVGSIRHGLIEVQQVFMTTYRQTSLGNPYGLSNETVISLLQDDDGSLWIGTDGDGINKLHPETGKFEHFRVSVGDKVTSIVRHSQHELLVSVFDQGIFFLNKKTGQKRRLLIMNEEENRRILKSGYAATLQKADNETVYILSDNIYRYNTRRKSFSTDSVQRVRSAGGYRLNKVASDDGNRFLYSLFALYRNTENGIWREIVAFPNEESVNAVALDRTGTLWIGTSIGLKQFNPDTDTAPRIVPMPENITVKSLVCDNRNRLWIGANGGLWVYDLQRKNFRLFNEFDGAISNEYLARPTLISQNGDVYMGGVNGLLFIDKNVEEVKITEPEIRLFQITTDNKNHSQLFDEDGNVVSSIRLAWDKSSVALRVIVQEKDIFRKRIFRYYVSGLLHEPIEIADQSLMLQSLPAGNYKVSVSCTLPDGRWSKRFDILTIHVSPPWWKTLWFNVLLVLGVFTGIVLGVFLFIWKKENALKWQMKAREKEVYEEKVRFLINISHELRTPLTLIYAPLKRMLSHLPEKEEVQKNIAGIYRQAANMKQIIDMVLNMRKIETGNEKLHLVPYPLHEWVAETADYFRDEAAHQKMDIRHHFDERVGEVAFDKEKCTIVLSNLLANALKFGTEGTSITISTELRQDENRVCIMVSDEGIGLGNADADRLFNHFYQGSHQRGGSGIGLAFSKTLVEMHGGTMGARNNEGGGASFYFDLPLNQQAHDVPLASKPYINELLISENRFSSLQYPQFPREDTSRYSLLAVEDNAELLAFLKQHFATCFRTVYTATNGEDALQIILRLQPDVVVSDVVMPRMDGFELCRRVKSDIAVSHIPVVLLTARGDTENVHLGYKLGADAYVAKPFDVDFLQTVLENQLFVRRQIKERYKSQSAVPLPQEIAFSNADEQFVLKLNALIEKHLADPQLNVAFIAAEMGMSRASLYNKMKELLNVGVNDYVNRIRLEKSAILLLSRRDAGIGEVASLCGFSSQRYFSTSFKQRKGVSPSDFRNGGITD